MAISQIFQGTHVAATLDLPVDIQPPEVPAAEVQPTPRRRAAGGYRSSGATVVAVDVVAVAVAVLLTWWVLSWLLPSAVSTGAVRSLVPLDFGILPFSLTAFACYGLYTRSACRLALGGLFDLRDVFHASLVAGVLAVTAEYLVHRSSGLTVPTPTFVGLVAVLSLPSVLAFRSGRAWLSGRDTRQATHRVILVGSGLMARTMSSHLRARRGVELLGAVDDDPALDETVLGPLSALPELCVRLDATRVVVCFSRSHPEQVGSALQQVPPGVRVSIVPRYFDLASPRSRVEDLYGMPLVEVARGSNRQAAWASKRVFDVLASSALLVLGCPMLAVVAVVIKLTSPGPVFFRQERAGRHGEPFWLLKFRTMHERAEEERDTLGHLNEVDGPLFKIQADPRVTSVGRFLRRTSIDELPQLLNVWRGDMSLVGPRPFVVAEAAAITGWARTRFEVRPGMTGLWQVSGRNELSYLELYRLDCQYVRSWSFWWDMNILWQTPAAMVRGRGAS